MKNVIGTTSLIAIILFISSVSLSAQSTKKGKYKVWVTKLDTTKTSKGYIHLVNDSSLTVLKSLGDEPHVIHVNVIDEVKLRQKGSVGKGLLQGALIGFAVGAIIGYGSGDDTSGFLRFSAESKALMIGTTFAIPSAIIGAFVGTRMNVKIPIDGDQRSYNIQKEKLKKYEVIF